MSAKRFRIDVVLKPEIVGQGDDASTIEISVDYLLREVLKSLAVRGEITSITMQAEEVVG